MIIIRLSNNELVVHSPIYLEDEIHLKWDNLANLFVKKVLDELSKYLS